MVGSRLSEAQGRDMRASKKSATVRVIVDENAIALGVPIGSTRRLLSVGVQCQPALEF
jgi:hypothetical protein